MLVAIYYSATSLWEYVTVINHHQHCSSEELLLQYTVEAVRSMMYKEGVLMIVYAKDGAAQGTKRLREIQYTC